LDEKKQANKVTKARSGEYCALNVKVVDERLVPFRSMLLSSVFFFFCLELMPACSVASECVARALVSFMDWWNSSIY